MAAEKNKIRMIVLKRRHCVVIAVFLLCLATAQFSRMSFWNVRETMALPLEGKVVLIDPGHGGIDAGAVANDAVEKELNLQISRIIQKYIEESGGIAILTRTEDVNTADPERGKNLSQKMSDLKERKKDIDDYNADVFLSIHMNKFQQPQYRGAQVFYTNDKTGESKILGETIQQTIKDTLEDNNNRKAKPSGNSIYILKENTVPSVLVECGFLSNADEAASLKNESHQRKIAWGIYLGLVKYLSR